MTSSTLFVMIALFVCLLTITPHDQVAANVFNTGSKTLEITDYSSVVSKGMQSWDDIESDNFTAGGYQWMIQVYPLGYATFNDSVSVFVTLLSSASNVKAIFAHHLYDWTASAWSTDTPLSSDTFTFAGPGSGWGYSSFITISALKASQYFKDDKFMIRTTLWVVKGSSTSIVSPLSDISGDRKDPRSLTVVSVPIEINNNNNHASA